jgi:hypothetical protein
MAMVLPYGRAAGDENQNFSNNEVKISIASCSSRDSLESSMGSSNSAMSVEAGSFQPQWVYTLGQKIFSDKKKKGADKNRSKRRRQVAPFRASHGFGRKLGHTCRSLSAMSDFSLDGSVGSCHSLHNTTEPGHTAKQGMVHPRLRARPISGKRRDDSQTSAERDRVGVEDEEEDRVSATLGEGDLWEKRQEALSVIEGFFDKEQPKVLPIAQKLRAKRAERCKLEREQTQVRQTALREKRRAAFESKLRQREKALEDAEKRQADKREQVRRDELSEARHYLDAAKLQQQKAVANADHRWLQRISYDEEQLKLAFLKAQRRLRETDRPLTVGGSAASEALAQQNRDATAQEVQAGRAISAPGPPLSGAGSGPLVRPRGKLKAAVRHPGSPTSMAAARPTSAQRSAALSRPFSAGRKLVAEGAALANNSAENEQRVAALERQVQHIQQQHAEKELEWEIERERLKQQVSELAVLTEV